MKKNGTSFWETNRSDCHNSKSQSGRDDNDYTKDDIDKEEREGEMGQR